MKLFRLALFALLAAAQLALPAREILRYERALSDGASFKVRAAPVDPEDPFRGRYVWLSLQPSLGGEVEIPPGRTLWAVLEEGPDGFARAARVTRGRPDDFTAVPVRTVIRVFDLGDRTSRIELLVDRYYMPEHEARRVEERLRRAGPAARAHAVIRVRDGVAAIESLVLPSVEDAEEQPQH